MKMVSVFLLFFTVFSAVAEPRVALIIGNSDYAQGSRFPDLDNPANDAELLATVLEEAGFKVFKAVNANKSRIVGLLSQFHEAIETGGDAVFYFAGHGVEHEKKNYLMATNAQFRNQIMLGEESVEVASVLRAMEAKRPKSALVFLDCCREYPDQTWLTSGRGYRGRGLTDMSRPDVVIAYAAAPGASAMDGTNLGLNNSPYAHALVKGIRLNLEITRLFKEVRREVDKLSGGQQRTWENGSFLHDFYFMPGGAAAKMIEKPAPEVVTNSLGMKFVPVPGTGVKFCIWETRVRDFRAFVEDTGYDYKKGTDPFVIVKDKGWQQSSVASWQNPGFSQTEDHPVCAVSWDDARAFCAWLSRKEGRTYRLPTDHEWSCAVGIGSRENAGKAPNSKDADIDGVYPWGTAWPPPADAGNYAGGEVAADPAWKTVSSLKTIPGFRDSYPRTAPVGQFAPNRLGIFDLGGNLYEWCLEFYDPDRQTKRVMRGASWRNDPEKILRSSDRIGDPAGSRYTNGGFRCVLENG